MSRTFAFGITICTALCAPSLALAGTENAVAVLDIQGTGIDPGLLPTLTEVLTVEISELGMYKVIAGRDIQSMLGFEKQKEVLGCTDAACLAEIGGALGVDRIVASHIGVVGSTFVVNIKLINIRMADTEGRVYETVRGETDALIATVRKSVGKLLGRDSKAAQNLAAKTGSKPPPQEAKDDHKEHIEIASATEPTTVETTDKSGGKGIGILPLVLWGVGAAGVVGGVVMGVNARSDERCANDGACVGGQVAAKRAPTRATISNVFFVAGGAAVAGGFAVLLLSGSDEAKTAWVPMVDGESVGLAVAGRF